jgi:PhnB protein
MEGNANVQWLQSVVLRASDITRNKGETAMTEQPSRSNITRGVIPYLNVEGAAKAIAFYQKAFGAKELARLLTQDGKQIMHCQLEINGGSLMLADCFAGEGYEHQPSHSFTMQLTISDADQWWSRAVAAGCEVTMPLETQFWGDRYGRMLDPFGVHWAFNEPAARK